MNCLRVVGGFTIDEYREHRHRFWPMPAAWGNPKHAYSLASLWKEGRVGVISLLPLLGQDAAMHYRDNVHLPIGKAARIAGIARETAETASDVLTKRGLAIRSLAKRRANSFSTWRVSPDFAPQDASGCFAPESFRFSSALLYGGNWAAIPGALRLVYLGLGTMAHTFDAHEASDFLAKRVLPSTWRDDLVRCLEQRGVLRLASASYDHIASTTGLHVASVKDAVRRIKHDASWTRTAFNSPAFERQPLAVYPAVNGQTLVYHFRDHLDPMPFDSVAPVERFCLLGDS